MFGFDPHSNFAITTVVLAPAPPTSGTSLGVRPGDGALFPNPSSDGEFNCVVWPAGVQPVDGNAEIVRVTAKSGDTFTIERQQEGSNARAIQGGDIIALSITAKTVDDLAQVLADIAIDAKAAGADSTGTTDATSIIQEAIDQAAVNGGAVYFPTGRYRISGTLTMRSNVALYGPLNRTARLVFDDVALDGIDAQGVIDNDTALASNITLGDRTATLTGGGGAAFAAGDWVMVSDEVLSGGHGTSPQWIVKLADVTGDVLTFEERAPWNYAAASTGIVSKVTPLENWSITDLTLETANVGVSELRSTAIFPRACVACQISRNNINGFTSSNGNPLQPDKCRDLTIAENRFLDCLDPPSTRASVTNLRIIDCFGLNHSLIVANIATHCGGGISTERSPYTNVTDNILSGGSDVALVPDDDGGRGIKIQYGSHYCIVSGNQVISFGYTGIRIDDSAYVEVIANMIFGARDAGIQVQRSDAINTSAYSQHCQIIANTIVNIWANPATFQGKGIACEGRYAKIADNTIIDVTFVGIDVTCNDAEILDNTVRAACAYGINLGGGATRNRIDTNTLIGQTDSAIGTPGASGGANRITGNIVDRRIDVAATDLLFNNPGAGPVDLCGPGDPNGAQTAPVGSTWRRSDGGAGTSFYVKETGAGNTGWVGK